jgi:flagellar export protein FliJ
MKRFKFTLQTVHDLRESKRESAERDLTEAANEVYRAYRLLEEVIRARQRALDNYLLLYQTRELEITMVSAHTDFIGSLMQRERESRDYVVEVEKRLTSKRQALTEALRATKTTAKLRDKQRERHDLELGRNEQSMLDEMAVMSVARRMVRDQ